MGDLVVNGNISIFDYENIIHFEVRKKELFLVQIKDVV